MPIVLYEGLPRTGKSYEMTTNPIYQALCSGRRVVANVAGLNYQLMRNHALDGRGFWGRVLGRKYPDIPPTPDEDELHNAHVLSWKYRKQLSTRFNAWLNPKKYRIPCSETFGLIDCISESELKATIQDGIFFCTDKTLDSGIETVVNPGDLVVIDECWFVFGKDCRITEETKFFFRKHGHYIHPFTGVGCDLILATQSVTALHYEAKAVIETTFYTVKLKALGLATRYRVEIYDRTIDSKSKKPLSKYSGKYDKSKFPWYSSHKGTGGNEAAVDKRSNVLRHPFFWLGLPLLGLLGVFSVVNVFDFLSGNKSARKLKEQNADTVVASSPSSVPASSTAPVPAQQPAKIANWRIVGKYMVKGYPVFLLANAEGVYRYLSPVPGSGVVPLTIRVDGEEVTQYSGVTQQKGLLK